MSAGVHLKASAVKTTCGSSAAACLPGPAAGTHSAAMLPTLSSNHDTQLYLALATIPSSHMHDELMFTQQRHASNGLGPHKINSTPSMHEKPNIGSLPSGHDLTVLVRCGRELDSVCEMWL